MSFAGEVLKYLIWGCPNLKKIACIFFNFRIVNCVCFIKQLFEVNPCQELEVFCFERCLLSEATFYFLISNLPKIKYIGNLEEWGMDKEAILRVREFIRIKNIDVDVESLHHSSYIAV